MKAWTLVITDGSFIEVCCFFGTEPPTDEIIYPKIDFQKNDKLDALLDTLKASLLGLINRKKGDNSVQFYVEGNKTYMFHLQMHNPREQGFVLGLS